MSCIKGVPFTFGFNQMFPSFLFPLWSLHQPLDTSSLLSISTLTEHAFAAFHPWLEVIKTYKESFSSPNKDRNFYQKRMRTRFDGGD